MMEGVNYCYRMMPFRLKNVGATYQRMMNTVFRDLIGRVIEVYVDDMIAKSTSDSDHIRVLGEDFDQLLKYNMRLNPKKCTFGVRASKFLCFMHTERGSRPIPTKVVRSSK